MKLKASPALVGMFVLGALVLAIGSLLWFGGVNFFSKPQRFVVYFDESTHGLDLGSPVKLLGVRVGRVVALNVRYNAQRNHSVVAVVCELNRNMITDDKGNQLDVADRAELQKLIDRGLRAHLGVLGLATGLLFVELDFYDPVMYPAPTDVADSKYATIPYVPSAISEFQTSLTEILADIKRIDFAGLALELRGMITDTRRQINGLNTPALSAQWTQAGQALTALATSPELKRVIQNLDTATKQLTDTLVKIDSKVEPASDKLGETLAEAQKALKAFNEAATTARNFVSAQSGLGEETGRAIQQLTDAASAVQRLADFLERNPNALLTGRKVPR